MLMSAKMIMEAVNKPVRTYLGVTGVAVYLDMT